MPRLTYEAVGITEPDEGVIQFEILPEHLKLLRSMQIAWNDMTGWGSAQTHPDRPYGTVDVYHDVQRILNNDSLTMDDVKRLHHGAAMALQISLKTGKYKAALFRASKYGQDWREYTPKKPKVNDVPDEPSPLADAEGGTDD